MLTDNVAGKKFVERKDPDFRRIDNHANPLVSDIPGPFDVAIASLEPTNSPDSLLLYGGKSVFGAKKLFYIIPGWIGLGGSNKDRFKGERQANMDVIDGIFCADELAKKIIMSQLKEFPGDRIYITGTPLMDSFEIEKASQYSEEGRRKLGIDLGTVAVWFSGDISSAYREKGWDVDERINEKTFFQAFAAMRDAASATPDKQFAFLVRPHPRDSNKNELLSAVDHPGDLPSNLKVLRATDQEATISELRYASDASIGILPTEGFIAPLLSREAAFLVFKEQGMGHAVFEQIYKDEGVRQIFAKNKNPRLIASPDELAKYLSGLKTASGSLSRISKGEAQKSTTERILEIALT